MGEKSSDTQTSDTNDTILHDLRLKERRNILTEASDESLESNTQYLLQDVKVPSTLLSYAKYLQSDLHPSLSIRLGETNWGFAHDLALRCDYCERIGLDRMKCKTPSSMTIRSECNSGNFDVNKIFSNGEKVFWS